MLKKLRIKFILINMTLVTLMLVLIFISLYVSTSRNLERESLQMMRSVAMNPGHFLPPRAEHEEINLPYFKVLLDRYGGVSEVEGGFFDLSDPDLVDRILEEASKDQSENGLLEEYNLRFLRMKTPMGEGYVFADISNERATLRSLIRNLFLIGSGAFLLFLLISFFLAVWAVRPVETAWKQQKQFVADASHELKTPLTVILTDAELLQAPECTMQEKSMLTEGILTMAEQMKGLVESLLELARIDNGSVKEAKCELVLGEIVQEAALLFEPLFFENGLFLHYEIEEDICMTGNRTHMRQLTEILLDNAAKYSSPGGKTVLSLKRLSSKKCLLTAANEGEPIPQKDLENLFRRFYRADKARTSCSSYGLGLSIAESIASEHNGRIRAESRNGWNSFLVELPLDKRTNR